MSADLSVTFTGIRFENPFLLASAPPTESDTNIMRAFEAGWGGVVTKTIGLHPVVNVAGPKTKFLRTDTDSPRISMKAAPGLGPPLLVELGAHLRQAARLVGGPPVEDQEGVPEEVLVASIMAGSGNDKELHNWQLLAKTCQNEGVDALELNFSCPHMDREDMGSNIGKSSGLDVDRHEGGQGSLEGAGLDEADAFDDRHRGRGRRRVPRRRGRDHLVEHVPVDPARGPRDARFRDERGRLHVERRPRRARDPPARAREDGPVDARVPGQGVLRDRRHLRLLARAQLLPPRLRHRAGLHGRDARPRDRPERDPDAEARG